MCACVWSETTLWHWFFSTLTWIPGIKFWSPDFCSNLLYLLTHLASP